MDKTLLTLLCIALISCGEEDKLSSRRIGTFEGTIEILDSIVFETSNETELVLDFKDGQYLGVTRSIDKILIWNGEGEKIHSFPVVGTGPDKVLSIDQLGFGFKGGFTLMDRSGVYTLSEEGTLTKATEIQGYKQSTPYPLHASHLSYLPNGNIVYASINDNFPSDDPIFFEESQGITCLDLENSSSEQIAFYEENSVYRDDVFPTEFQPVFDLSSDSIFFIRPLDHKYLQVSTCESKEAIKVPIKLDYSSDLYKVNGVGLDNQMKVIQLNTLVKDLSVNDSLVAIHYEAALDLESFTLDLVALNENPNYRKRFLSLYDRTSRSKLGMDVRLPDMLFKILHISDEGIFHFSRRYGYGNESTVVYRLKVNYGS